MDIKELLGRPASNTVANGNLNSNGNPLNGNPPNGNAQKGNLNQLGPDYAWSLALKAKADGILIALNGIKPEGSFVGFGKLQTSDFAGRLGLHVDGIGNITVPLQEEQARQLIAQCRQAPFGKGSETIVDTSVRNTWELDASQFRFNSDAWAGTLDKCVAFAKKTLGIASPIIADPYKMLIYEKGAMFKAHTDTEKIPGMFGTLVICLPSHHTGGDIVLRHAGQEKTHKTSEVQPSVLCWYSDVHHEVLPVTSGYRWVLTYNLAMSPDLERPSAALRQPQTGQLQQSIASWLQHVSLQNREQAAIQEVPHMYYLLEHEYTEASIALRGLKTTDLARVQCLQNVSTKLDFDVFLAVLEKRQEGGVEHVWTKRKKRSYYDDYEYTPPVTWHELNDIYKTFISIKKLVDLDGYLLRAEMEITKDDLERNLVQGGDPFEGVTDRNEEYEGYMGNSGPTATHFYRTTVAVLIPRSLTDRFLTQKVDLRTAQAMLRPYAERYLVPGSEPTRRQSAVETMRRLAKTAWIPNPASYEKPDPATVLEVLKAAVLCREYDLFNDALGLVHTTAVPPTIFGRVKESALAAEVDVSKIKKSILDNVLQGDLEHRGSCLQLLRPSGEERNDDLAALATEIVGQSVRELEDVLEKGLLKESDGPGIMIMIDSPQGYDSFKSRVLPVLVAATPTNTAFVLGALQSLSSCISEERFPQPESLDILKQLSNSVITNLDVSKLRTPTALLAAQPRRYYTPQVATLTPEQSTLVLDPVTLASFTRTLLTHSWHDLLTALSQKITTQAATIPTTEYIPFWLPFLQSLLHNHAGSPSPHYRTITVTLLTAYFTHHVGTEPAPDPSLALPRTRCSCGDCIPLNAFLAAPDKREVCFSIGERRRRHMERVLESSPGAGLVQHANEYGGACGALTVTKVGTYAQRLKGAWEGRVAAARKWLGVLGERGVLGTVIGYVGAEGEEVPEVLRTFLRDSGVELSGDDAGGSKGVKRKAEEDVEVVVID